jgi:hypothetical protein
MSQLNDQQRLKVVYETITSHLPDEDEAKILLNLVNDMKVKYQQNPEDAKALCNGLAIADSEKLNELAAWTMVVNAIYNLDITKTRE